ncbi:TIGR03032 family protein [Bauldia litoralis]|uniref:TIGR03032 family protein n=1 Tax=Bauldia litoralis TaxID=665467 RepID=UPI003263A145
MIKTNAGAAGDSEAETPPPAETPRLEITTSRQFVSWLAEAGGSLAFTTYQSGKVFLIGSNRGARRLSVFERTLDRPMGMAVSGKRLCIASMNQITTFVDAAEGAVTGDGYDAVYVPQLAHFTGDLDVHDLGFDAGGRIVFANTLFSCLAAASETHSFRPLWQPPFISRLAAEDRCHLNGLAMSDGTPAYVTAVGETDVADGWRDNRAAGGVVVDVAANAIVCRGLSMPHSPRLHEGKLYVLNSGAGEFGTIDLASGRFDPIAFCPGYLRGLTFLAGHAIVGLSEPRENRTFGGLPLQDRLVREKVEPRCGLYVIDLRTGDVAHWLRLEGFVSELYDVAALPGVARPSMIGFRSDDIRRTISIEP